MPPEIKGDFFGTGTTHPARVDVAAKELLPLDLGADEWQRISRDVKQRAIFSAHVTDAKFLQSVKDVTARLVSPEIGADGTPNAPGEYVNPATARETLREAMQGIGFEPTDEGEPKMAQLSDARLDLIVDTNRDLAWGFGEFTRGNTDAALEAFPCWELVRYGPRDSERDWPERWAAAGGEFYGGGRMIAPKDSEVWQALGDGDGLTDHDGRDALGNPFPPFAYNSGMWVEDVSREEAIDLGVIEAGDDVSASDVGLNDALEAGAQDLDAGILGALLASASGLFHAEQGAVRLADGA